MGFLFNISKSSLLLNETRLERLRIQWNIREMSLSLTVNNLKRVADKLFLVSVSNTIMRHQYENLMGSLNYAAEGVPLSHLHHRMLTLEGNCHFPLHHRDNPPAMPAKVT